MHDLIDTVANGGETIDTPGRTPRLRPGPDDLETGNGWPMGVFARYRTRGGAVIDLSRGLTTAIEVSCGGCPYQTVIDPLIDSIDGATYKNAGEKFEELAWTAAKTHADQCGTADYAPPGETLTDRLEFATDQVEVNTDEIINHHLTMADLPGLTTYLRAVIDQCYQIATIAQKTVNDEMDDIELGSCYRHTAALSDVIYHHVCVAEQQLETITPSEGSTPVNAPADQRQRALT
jgi:hypothetical protein